jgi:hypothetical protein
MWEQSCRRRANLREISYVLKQQSSFAVLFINLPPSTQTTLITCTLFMQWLDYYLIPYTAHLVLLPIYR